MCSYCGCGAEPLVTGLMDDHGLIADLAYRTERALGSGCTALARSLLAELAERFKLNSLKEEAGLFAELAAAGEASAEVEELLADPRMLRPLLAEADPGGPTGPVAICLARLARHAETEDTDLFPYALPVLSARSWDGINRPTAGLVAR